MSLPQSIKAMILDDYDGFKYLDRTHALRIVKEACRLQREADQVRYGYVANTPLIVTDEET